jgi:hypothetical protein
LKYLVLLGLDNFLWHVGNHQQFAPLGQVIFYFLQQFTDIKQMQSFTDCYEVVLGGVLVEKINAI